MLTRQRVAAATLRTGDIIASCPPRVALEVERSHTGVYVTAADARPPAFYGYGGFVNIWRPA